MDSVPSQPEENEPALEKIYSCVVEFGVQTQASFITPQMADEDSPTMAAVEELESVLTAHLETCGYKIESLSYHFEEDLLGVWATDDEAIDSYDIRATIYISLECAFAQNDVLDDPDDSSVVPTEDALNAMMQKLEDDLFQQIGSCSLEITNVSELETPDD